MDYGRFSSDPCAWIKDVRRETRVSRIRLRDESRDELVLFTAVRDSEGELELLVRDVEVRRARLLEEGDPQLVSRERHVPHVPQPVDLPEEDRVEDSGGQDAGVRCLVGGYVAGPLRPAPEPGLPGGSEIDRLPSKTGLVHDPLAQPRRLVEHLVAPRTGVLSLHTRPQLVEGALSAAHDGSVLVRLVGEVRDQNQHRTTAAGPVRDSLLGGLDLLLVDPPLPLAAEETDVPDLDFRGVEHVEHFLFSLSGILGPTHTRLQQRMCGTKNPSISDSSPRIHRMSSGRCSSDPCGGSRTR